MTSVQSLGARGAASNASHSRVYVSFDVDNDRELYERLLAQARGSSFCVSGETQLPSSSEAWNERARHRISEADQMIIICGQHTDASQAMSVEIRIAQEEQTPYFLLWGRRAEMCTKPVGAKSAEGMYNWTWEILQDQVAIGHRRARALSEPRSRVSRVPVS